MSQNRELDIARFIVEKTDSNIFLTGKAGTGKTTFLKDVKKYTKKNHIVLAPTGVAAVNAGAMTIHSFFQFGFGPYVKGISEPEGNYMMRREKRELIKSLELIIIDEISMVRADVLDHINDELQRIRRNSEPFGGVQLLMIGDLKQLPPITPDNELEILKPHYDSMYFFDSKSLRNSDYYCIELKSVYRQTDQRFIDILNRVRTGETDTLPTQFLPPVSWQISTSQCHYARGFEDPLTAPVSFPVLTVPVITAELDTQKPGVLVNTDGASQQVPLPDLYSVLHHPWVIGALEEIRATPGLVSWVVDATVALQSEPDVSAPVREVIEQQRCPLPLLKGRETRDIRIGHPHKPLVRQIEPPHTFVVAVETSSPLPFPCLIHHP